MSSTTAHPLGYTLGQAAAHFGVETWQMAKLFDRGLLAPDFASRIGILRVIRPEQMPAVEQALQQAGYLAEVE